MLFGFSVSLPSWKEEEKMPGFEVAFVDKPRRRCLCPVCRLPMRDPVQIKSCGHSFCDVCLQGLLRYGAIIFFDFIFQKMLCLIFIVNASSHIVTCTEAFLAVAGTYIYTVTFGDKGL